MRLVLWSWILDVKFPDRTFRRWGSLPIEHVGDHFDLELRGGDFFRGGELWSAAE